MASIEPKDQIDILMKEYALVKDEMQTYINLFHRHTNFLHLLLPTTIALVSATFAIFAKSDTNELLKIFNENSIMVFNTPLLVSQLFGFLAFVLITTAGLFSASASLSYMYIIELLARRVEKIEHEVNNLVGRKLLYWEIGISSKLIRVSKVSGIWIKPSASRILWSYIGFLFVLAFMISVAWKFFGFWLAFGFIAYTLFGIFFETAQYIQYTRKVIPKMIEIINEVSLEPNKDSGETNQTDVVDS